MRTVDDAASPALDIGIDGPMNDASNAGAGGVDVMSAVLRYKWAVLIPSVVGALAGLVAWTQLPETYESAAILLVESDSPVILDATTGEVVKGVPGADVLQAQLFSDDVLMSAITGRGLPGGRSPIQQPDLLEIIEDEFGGSFGQFTFKCVDFESQSDSKGAPNSLALRLTVQHSSKELVFAASQALTQSLVSYFDNKRQAAIEELRGLVRTATQDYEPTLEALYTKQRLLQAARALEFDESGRAINPHRMNVVEFKKERAEAAKELMDLEGQLKIVGMTITETEDPLQAIRTVGQILNKDYGIVDNRKRELGIKDSDFTLKFLNLEQQLVPVIVERDNLKREFGDEHPSVRKMDAQIEATRTEIDRIARQFADRVAALMQDSAREIRAARDTAQTVLNTLNAQVASARARIADLDKLITVEKGAAEQLAAAEQENAHLLRQIEQASLLLNTLRDQMQRLDLADSQGGVVLTLLNNPSQARIVGPNLMLLLAGGLGLGLVFGSGLAYLLEAQAGTFRTAEEIGNFLRVQVLCHVPYDSGRRGKSRKGEEDPYAGLDDKLSVLHRPMSMAAEAIRACRTAIFFEAGLQGARVIQVTSPLPSDGKTTVAGNLAVSFAQAGKRVIIIDCDLRRPQISENFGLRESEGLTNILNGDCDPLTAIHVTAVKNLSVIPSGPIPLNPAEALTLPEFGELIAWLKDSYDYVIVDTPPLLVVTDPSIVAGVADGVVMTMKVRRKSKENSREAISILRSIGANIIGVVVNASDDTAGSDGYKGYGYYRYSRYASKYNVESGYARKRSGGGGAYQNGKKGTLIVGSRETWTQPNGKRHETVAGTGSSAGRGGPGLINIDNSDD